MKNFIKKSCCGCALMLTSMSYAAEPLSFGIAVEGRNSMASGFTEAKAPFSGKEVETSLLNLGLRAGAFGEYAFHDYIGAKLGGAWVTGRLATFNEKSGKAETEYKVSGDRIEVTAGPVIYVLGYDNDENGRLRFAPLFAMAIPLSGSAQKGSEKSTEIKSDEFNIGYGARGELGYEIFGLDFLLAYQYELTGLFKEESKFKTGTLGIAKDKGNNLQALFLGLGYNFATLLE